MLLYPQDKRPNIPPNLQDSSRHHDSYLTCFIHVDWQKKTRLSYEGEMRTKNAELESLAKQGLKDSIRTCFQDMAKINIKYGFSSQALAFWEKAYEQSSQSEDQKRLCTTIIKTAFTAQNKYYLDRFCRRGPNFFNSKQPEFQQFIYVMQFLSRLMENQAL